MQLLQRSVDKQSSQQMSDFRFCQRRNVESEIPVRSAVPLNSTISKSASYSMFKYFVDF